MTNLLALISGVFLLAGGLLLMRYGLSRLLWHRLQKMLISATGTPVRGLITGTVAAALFQSSTAVCLLTISLVTAGYLTFRQALGIILGANIGTCSTVGLIGFVNMDKLLPVLLAAASLALCFRKSRNLGWAAAGLLGMFSGLHLLNHGMKELQTFEPVYRLLLLADSSPWHGILAGILITFVFQSSSAATVMVVSLSGNGLFDLTTAAYMVYGANLGSCLSSVLVSAVAPLAARRVAAAHVLVNLLGILIFLPVTGQFVALAKKLSGDTAAQITVLHTAFNLVSSLAVLPLTGQFVRLVELLIPQSKVIWR